MLFEVEVELRDKKTLVIEAEDPDDAAFKATERCEDDGLTVTGTYVQRMDAYDLKEMKVAHLI
ncbi:MAG: hypothetical protein PHI12_08660 [Dehalococcoidales bacterium]|nr:hypothetical protein [Dehalococcoidales bacterium]